MVLLARIAGPRGVRGEVKIRPYTHDPLEMESYGKVLVGTEEQGFLDFTIEKVRQVGAGRFALKFRGVDDRNQAERLMGLDIAVPRSSLPPPPEGEYYWHDLIGMTVVTESGVRVGSISSIIETGANDVYVVSGQGKEALIPAVEEVVLSIDVEAGIMVIKPLPGLLEANEV